MEKLLRTGKTDLLQFVSARTRRPFSAFLVRQKDGKVGFEFEAKDPSKKGRPQRTFAPVRVLGIHPKDKQPVELHAGRYGPYVKHRDVNATLPDREKMDSLTLDEALALLDAKAGTSGAKPRTPVKERRAKPTGTRAAEPKTPVARGGAAAARSKVKSREAPRSTKTKPPASSPPRAAAVTRKSATKRRRST
jgi:topoisomerase IA-like protein